MMKAYHEQLQGLARIYAAEAAAWRKDWQISRDMLRVNEPGYVEGSERSYEWIRESQDLEYAAECRVDDIVTALHVSRGLS